MKGVLNHKPDSSPYAMSRSDCMFFLLDESGGVRRAPERRSCPATGAPSRRGYYSAMPGRGCNLDGAPGLISRRPVVGTGNIRTTRLVMAALLVLELVPHAAALSRCETALEGACGARCRGHGDAMCTFECASCAGGHQSQLLSNSGCDNDAIAAWCAGVVSPTVPVSCLCLPCSSPACALWRPQNARSSAC